MGSLLAACNVSLTEQEKERSDLEWGAMTSGLKERNYWGRKGIRLTQGELLTKQIAPWRSLAGQGGT